MSTIPTVEQKQRVKEILAETEMKLTAEIGKPVSVLYRIKVNHLNPTLIIQQVLTTCNVSYSEVLSKSKEQKCFVPRRLIMWLVSYYCGFNSHQIAPLLNVDNSAVRHGIEGVNNALDVADPIFLVPLKDIEKKLLAITG
jgi:chromosomal replication initiation ATPase DnaA